MYTNIYKYIYTSQDPPIILAEIEGGSDPHKDMYQIMCLPNLIQKFDQEI